MNRLGGKWVIVCKAVETTTHIAGVFELVSYKW